MNEFHQSETKESDSGKAENFQKIKPEVALSSSELSGLIKSELNQVAEEARYGKRELSEDEINERQNNQIECANEWRKNGKEMSTIEQGNEGEMRMDQYYIKQGYSPIHENRVASLDDKMHKGLDGVYEKTMPDGTKRYVIVEAKVNSSELSILKDGTKQMSDKWVDERLDNAVGKEKADEIRDAFEDNPESVSKEVYHFSYIDTPDGTSRAETIKVDSGGEKGERKVVQEFDRDGHEINGGVNGD